MQTRTLGIIMNGVTGRMGTHQHLVRSILAIRGEGGVHTREAVLVPEPLLVGRDAGKLAALSAAHGNLPWTTDLDSALGDGRYGIYFDAQSTPLRHGAVRRALAAGKHVYCEKPAAATLEEALDLYRAAEQAGVRHGVVQDKLWLPGMVTLRRLLDTGFLGRVLSVRGEFGYWVFTGHDQPAQRPSWNYRRADGGGIILDMFCHWRYLIDNLFGTVTGVSATGAVHLPERVDESGTAYACDAEDAAYATFETDRGILCQFNSSWCVRVRRDDLLTVQVDGTRGSAVAGLRRCRVQHDGMTPRPVWNPDVESPMDYLSQWAEAPLNTPADNAFKAQWELFLRHVALGEPFRWNLLEGARGLQLAERGHASWRERRWVDVPPLAP